MKYIKIIVLTFTLLLGISATSVSAQGNISKSLENLGRLGEKTGTTETDVGNVVGTAINAALTLVGIIFLILMVYAGYLWMTARGEEGPIESAKKIIRAAIIGLVLVMSAYAITFFITSRFDTKGKKCQPTDSRTSEAVCNALSDEACTRSGSGCSLT